MPSDPNSSLLKGVSQASVDVEMDIIAQRLGKKFDIYINDKDRVFELFSQKSFHEQFWALKDVTFGVSRGTAYGIIGSNGAGKSTLLKLLAGVSRPSEGSLSVRGSISSLLDLGLAFHQDFSGRDNIYLNCTVLGLSRREIDDIIPEIVSFAELESFIDYPVKTYSSGMCLRLGFAIAGHLNYQIFLIDEVLTVGDQYFQRKCVRKIEEFIEKGRTIILVSHDLHSVRSLCERVMWLRNGRVVADGPAAEVVDAYLDAVRSRERGVVASFQRGDGTILRLPAEEPLGLSSLRPEVSQQRPQTEESTEAFSRIEEGPPVDAASAHIGQDSVLKPSSVGLRSEGIASEQNGKPGEGVHAGFRESISTGARNENEVENTSNFKSEGTDSDRISGGSLELVSGDKMCAHGEDGGSSRRDEMDPVRGNHGKLRTYRSTSSDPSLRKHVLAVTTLEEPSRYVALGDEVEPFMEYHGDLPLVTGSGEVKILDVMILGRDFCQCDQFITGSAVTVAVMANVIEPITDPIFGVAIHRNDDVYVYGPNTGFDRCMKGVYHGLYTFFLHYPSLPLLAGTYLFSVAVFDRHHLKPYVWHNRLYPATFKADREDHGLVVIPHEWGVVSHVVGSFEDLDESSFAFVKEER